MSEQRTCLVTGEAQPKGGLIRFVLDPSHVIVPDLAGKLPGRGAWVSASRESLETAIKKNLLTRALKTHTKPAPDMVDQIARLLEKRCLDVLGLARGAGILVMGQTHVEEAVAARSLAYVLVASDAGADGLKKLHHATSVPCGFTRVQLGEALGRGSMVYIGVKPHALAEKLREELERRKGIMRLESTDCI